MGKRFFECTGEGSELRAGSDAQDGFAEAVDPMGSFFEGLGSGVMRVAGDDDLNRMMRKERGG